MCSNFYTFNENFLYLYDQILSSHLRYYFSNKNFISFNEIYKTKLYNNDDIDVATRKNINYLVESIGKISSDSNAWYLLLDSLDRSLVLVLLKNQKK